MEHLTLALVIVAVSFTLNVYASHVSKAQPLINGKPANPGEFPHSVFFKYENEFTPVCGGAIIGSKYILTKADCITSNKSFEVMVGCVEYFSSYCIPFQVAETIIHPKFNGTYHLHNIGIVVLTEDIVFDALAQPIPLSSKQIEPGTQLNATGMDSVFLDIKWLNLRSETDSDCITSRPEVNTSVVFCTSPGMFAVPGVYGFPVEFVGHLVGIALNEDLYDLVLRVEPYIRFIYDVIQEV